MSNESCPHSQTTETEVCPGAFGCYDIMNKLKDTLDSEDELMSKVEAVISCATGKLSGGAFN